MLSARTEANEDTENAQCPQTDFLVFLQEFENIFFQRPLFLLVFLIFLLGLILMEARIADISTRLTESRDGLGLSTLHTDAAGQPSFLHLLLFLTFLANGGF